MADEQMESTPASGGGKSNTIWYVVGGVIILVLVAWFAIRGVGIGAMKLAGAANGVDVQTGVNGAMTYTGTQGSVTVGGGTMPSNWPSDAPANFAGASISYSGTSNPQTGKAGSAVVYTVSASAQTVVDYYKTELQKAGWTIAGTANAGAATVLSATKDKRGLGVYIADAGSGMVSVTVGIEM